MRKFQRGENKIKLSSGKGAVNSNITGKGFKLCTVHLTKKIRVEIVTKIHNQPKYDAGSQASE